MLVQKKNYEDFYKEIRQEFPRMKQLGIWEECDWSNNGYEHSMIMSELSQEMAIWITEGLDSEVQRLMDTIERYFEEGTISVTSIIYTDFLVTIMEAKKEVRDIIKSMMGSETQKLYQKLFDGYRESKA